MPKPLQKITANAAVSVSRNQSFMLFLRKNPNTARMGVKRLYRSEVGGKEAKRAEDRRPRHVDQGAVTLAAIEIEDFLKLIEKGRAGLALPDALEHRRKHGGLHAACGTLPAGFVSEKLRDAQRLVEHRGVFVVETHHAAPQRRTSPFKRFGIKGYVKLIGFEESARRPRKNRFQFFAARQSPADFLIETTEWSAERQFIEAWRLHLGTDAEEHCSRVPGRSIASEPFRPVSHNLRDIRERLDIVDDGRLSEQTRCRR